VRRLKDGLIMLMTLSFLAFTVAQAEPSGFAAAIAAVAITTLLCVRHAASAAYSHEITIGRRAREHREALSVMPSPQHPHTAGRPRTRAPARPLAAA